MDLITLVVLLISLTAAVIAGITVLYKRKRDPEYIKSVKNQKKKPLMGNTGSFDNYMATRLGAIPYAILLVLVLVMLAKCGIV